MEPDTNMAVKAAVVIAGVKTDINWKILSVWWNKRTAMEIREKKCSIETERLDIRG